MPQLTLNLNVYDPQDEQYGVNAWITLVKWREINNIQLGTGRGLYIIDDGARPVYAGKADNIRSRFNGRSEALNEFRVTAAVSLANYRVFAGSVVAVPANYPNKIDWAEWWLVRFLYLYDQAQLVHYLQNIQLTGQITFPAGGFRVRFDPNDVPGYLLGGANYVVVNPNSAGYNYNAGAQL